MVTMNFRSEATRKAVTESLFLEQYRDDGSRVLYTLKAEDQVFQGRNIPSIRRLYLELNDPTEYEFANTYFESWDHWETISQLAFMKPHVDKWRRELNLKMKAEAIKRIQDEAKRGKNSFAANKYLIDKPWAGEDTKGSWKMGRPSKEAIKEEAAKMAEQFEQIEADLERLQLN